MTRRSIKSIREEIMAIPHPIDRAKGLASIAQALPDQQKDLMQLLMTHFDDIIMDRTHPIDRAKGLASIAQALPDQQKDLMQLLMTYFDDIIMAIRAPTDRARGLASIAQALTSQQKRLLIDKEKCLSRTYISAAVKMKLPAAGNGELDPKRLNSLNDSVRKKSSHRVKYPHLLSLFGVSLKKITAPRVAKALDKIGSNPSYGPERAAYVAQQFSIWADSYKNRHFSKPAMQEIKAIALQKK